MGIDLSTLGGGSFSYSTGGGGDTGSSNYSSSSSTTDYPEWYKNYLKDLAARSTEQSLKPYEAYTGDRTADFNPDQLSAMEMIRQAATNPEWQGQVDQWKDPMASVPGMMLESADMTRRHSEFDPAKYQEMYDTIYDPAVQALQAEANRIGNQDFQDTTLATLNRNYLGSGGFGGGRNQVLSADAAARAQAEIEGKKAGYMMDGAKSASTDYLNWAKQGLSGAQQLMQTGQGIQQGGLNALNYGTAIQGAIGADASALAGVGKQQQDAAQKDLDVNYANFLERRDFPWTQINNATGAFKGVTIPQTTTSSSSSGGSSWGHTEGQSSISMNLPGQVGPVTNTAAPTTSDWGAAAASMLGAANTAFNGGSKTGNTPSALASW